MRPIILVAIFISLGSIVTGAQTSTLITSNAAGSIKLGMTIAHARRAMKGYRLKRVSDGEGVALIGVARGGRQIMTLYAGEEDRDAKINENAKIEQIWVWDPRYRTAHGIHPNMLVKNAERILGKVKRVFMSEIESREYAEFRKKTKGLMFRIGVNSSGKYLTAGIYVVGTRRGTRCVPTASIIGIEISDYFN